LFNIICPQGIGQDLKILVWKRTWIYCDECTN